MQYVIDDNSSLREQPCGQTRQGMRVYQDWVSQSWYATDRVLWVTANLGGQGPL